MFINDDCTSVVVQLLQIQESSVWLESNAHHNRIKVHWFNLLEQQLQLLLLVFSNLNDVSYFIIQHYLATVLLQ